MKSSCHCSDVLGPRTEAQRCFSCQLRTTTIDTSGQKMWGNTKAPGRVWVGDAPPTNEQLERELLAEGPKRSLCCDGCHLYPCIENSGCSVWLEAAHKRMAESMFDNAELWYAAEVDRMSKRAPA